MSTIQHRCMVCHNAALITCVSNAGGLGPGHTCVVIDKFVYTFERFLAGWVNMQSSGWVKIKTADYLKQNVHRPVIIQELSNSVNASSIYEYISMSDLNDADYLSSGVCSQQAIKAISAGLKTPISHSIVNIPSAVYSVVKKSGYVKNTSYVFPDEGTGVRPALAALNMWGSFPGANTNKTTNPNILRW